MMFAVGPAVLGAAALLVAGAIVWWWRTSTRPGPRPAEHRRPGAEPEVDPVDEADLDLRTRVRQYV